MNKENPESAKDCGLQLQGLLQKFIKRKDVKVVFKMLLFLIRKYLPRNFSVKIDIGNYL